MKKNFNWPFNISLFSWNSLAEHKILVTFVFFCLVLGLLVRAYFVLHLMEYEKQRATFNKDASVFSNSIENKFKYSSDVVTAFQNYFNAGGVPSYEVFKKLADSYREEHKEIKALLWLPHITESERENFLREARKTFPPFQILDLQKNNTLAPSSHAYDYYPIYYVIPQTESEMALGFNYLSSTERSIGIEESRDAGETTMTPPLRLILKNEMPPGFILISPVYKQNQPIKSVEEKRKNILGVVAGVFETEDIFHMVPSQDREKFHIVLLDPNAPKGKRLLYSTQNTQKISSSGLFYEKAMTIDNKNWIIQLSPREGHYHPTLQPVDIFTLVFASLLLLITTSYIWFMLKYYEEHSALVAQFTNLLESTSRPTFIFDKDLKIISVNHNLEKFSGYSISQLVGQSCEIFLKKSISDRFKIIQEEILQENAKGLKKTVKIASVAHIKNGNTIPVEIEIDSLIANPHKNLFVCTFTDLRKINELEKNLERSRLYDILTKLPNKKYFEEAVKNEIAKSLYIGNPIAILIINLDHFKDINKSFDLTTGDMLLKLVAERIKKEIRSQDIVARMNGDEFALLTTAAQTKEQVQHVAQRLLNLFERPFQFGNKEIKLSASIGISFSFHGSIDPIALLNKAELAMYNAKNKGENSYAFYQTGIDTIYRRQFELETALNSAVQRNEFYLEYQPIYEVPRKRIVGVEALLRWNYPPLGLIPPFEFIPFVEDKPLIKTIGKWVFETACRDYKRWGAQFEGYLTINFAALQLEDKDYMEDLVTFCKTEGIPLEKIVLEVTESTFMQPTQKNKKLMKIIALKGFPLSVDDFGTKYASLGRLTSFPSSYLKIDKSFIDGIGRNNSEEEIIISIINLAQKLNLKTIAEGVETKEQLDFLMLHHCRYIQGFYFSRPINFDGITTLLKKSAFDA